MSKTIKPMLAKPISLNQFSKPVLVQPKIDGIRAIFNPKTQQLTTRNGNVIHSCDHIILALTLQGLNHLTLDGEIYTDALPFEVINGLVRAKQPQAETLKLQYHIFDRVDYQVDAAKRAEMLAHILPNEIIRPVPTFIATPDNVDFYYQAFLELGFEGLIARDPKALYQGDRCDALRKLKPTEDMEAVLVGFEATDSDRNRSSFGAMVLRLRNGKTFRCSGLSDRQRQALWQRKPLGESVTFTFQGFTADGVPRFPRFKAVRHDI